MGQELKAVDFKVLDTKRDGVHWGWWVMWLLLCWPVLFFTAVIHFNSQRLSLTAIKYSDGSVTEKWLTKRKLSELEMEIGGW